MDVLLSSLDSQHRSYTANQELPGRCVGCARFVLFITPEEESLSYSLELYNLHYQNTDELTRDKGKVIELNKLRKDVQVSL